MIAALSDRWRRWVALLDRREDGASLALVRVLCAGIIAAHLANSLRTGTWRWVWVDAADGGLRALNPVWLAHFGGLTPGNVQALIVATLIAALAMMGGLLTRAAVFAVWFGYGTLADLNGHAGGSYDELLKNVLFLLLLSGCGSALSLDRRLGLDKGGPVAAWPRWAMIFQLVLMYWTTALQKLSSSWIPIGELDALWYILWQPTWQRFTLPLADLAWAYPITQLMTLSVWCFEQAAPLLLLAYWYRDTRERGGWLRGVFNSKDFRGKFLLFGLGMHVGIEVLMEVGSFSWATMCLYVACFHPEEWRGLLRSAPAPRSAAPAPPP